MTAFFNRACPHCGHKTTFQICGSYMGDPGFPTAYAFGQCMGCHLPVAAEFDRPFDFRIDGNIEPYGVRVRRSWPEAPRLECPAHAAERPSNLYLQGLDNLRRQNWDAAGMAFRTCLDQALRSLHPEGKGTLYKRIEALPEDIGVTPSMKAWAHEIRALGNEAAHEDEPFDAATAGDLQKFIEVFLMYAFTLPGMLAERHPRGPDAQ